MRFLNRLQRFMGRLCPKRAPARAGSVPVTKEDVAPSLDVRIAAAQLPDFYDAAYFDRPKDVGSESGYAGYTSREPGIDVAIRIATKYFSPRCVLDVGCAKGFVVAGLRQLGVEAWGVDFSRYAVEAAPKSVRGYVDVGDATALQFDDSTFDLVICNETLEHLSPERAKIAISELYRVTSRNLWVTTPSLGPNGFGPPDGWPQGKVREDALLRYMGGMNHPDPVPFEDLLLDKNGYPIHGHLTVASYLWWTEQFTRQGFVRRGDIEIQMNLTEPLLRDGQWNSYVFEKPMTGSKTLEADSERRNILTELMNRRFGRDLEVPITHFSNSGVDTWAMTLESADQLFWRAADIPLPPGWYEIHCTLSVAPEMILTSEYAWVAMLEVRSSDARKIHALRVLRGQDFVGAPHQDIPLQFASSGESDFEFRIRRSHLSSVHFAPRIVLGVA